jgi:hypothetical protein
MAAAFFSFGALLAQAKNGGDACALLSAAQVSTGPGGPSIGSKKIVLSLMTARSFAAGKTPVKGVTMSVAEGVGDEAYFISMPPFGTALSVKKGDAYFQLRIAGFPSGQVRTLERALALRLLDRV